VDRKTYAKPSAFVKYVIKFVGTANPITNFEFAEEYVKNNVSLWPATLTTFGHDYLLCTRLNFPLL